MINSITFSNLEYFYFRKYLFNYIEIDGEGAFESVEDDYIEYKPWEIEDLYKRFASLNPDNTAELIDFIQEYGNIGNYHRLNGKYIEYKSLWVTEILRFKQLVLLSDLYKTENINYSIELLDIKNNYLLKTTKLYDFIKDFGFKHIDKIDSYDLKISCLTDIQELLNPNIRNLSFVPLIGVDQEGDPFMIARIEIPNLLAFMYWQFYSNVFSKEKYFVCAKCGETFPWVNHRKNYICPKCFDKERYKVEKDTPKNIGIKNFMNATSYYTSTSKHSCQYIKDNDKEFLSEARDAIKEEAEEKKNTMSDEKFTEWINKRKKIFIDNAKKMIIK